jgi:hypothetical protein
MVARVRQRMRSTIFGMLAFAPVMPLRLVGRLRPRLAL